MYCKICKKNVRSISHFPKFHPRNLKKKKKAGRKKKRIVKRKVRTRMLGKKEHKYQKFINQLIKHEMGSDEYIKILRRLNKQIAKDKRKVKKRRIKRRVKKRVVRKKRKKRRTYNPQPSTIIYEIEY